MGFELVFMADGEIKVQLPKENSKEKWELTKKIIDMYFSTEPQNSVHDKAEGNIE